MKITIFTHPNSKLSRLNILSQTIRKNAKVYVDIECDWKKVSNYENVSGMKIYALSDPFETIQLCMESDELNINEKEFRWNTIKEKTNYNLEEFSKLEAACLSYLLWPEICKENGLDFIFKIEDPTELFKYLEIKGILNDNVRYEHIIFNSYKPINLDEYKKIGFGTINLLGRYCIKYNYSNYLKGLK